MLELLCCHANVVEVRKCLEEFQKSRKCGIRSWAVFGWRFHLRCTNLATEGNRSRAAEILKEVDISYLSVIPFTVLIVTVLPAASVKSKDKPKSVDKITK
jgi:hypothetical protein